MQNWADADCVVPRPHLAVHHPFNPRRLFDLRRVPPFRNMVPSGNILARNRCTNEPVVSSPWVAR